MAYKLTQEEREFLLSIMPKIKQRARTKVQATDELGDCAYRADGEADNIKPKNCCFIGAIIPPEHYAPSLEGRLGDDDGVISAIGYAGDASSGFRRVLIELQNMHDNDDPIHWGAGLDRIEQDIKG